MKDIKSDVEAANNLVKSYQKLNDEISKIVIGQEEVIKLVLISIFCQGHSLLVGVPGLAKTLSFNRIQFTPDLMPSDILGSETLDINRNFQFIKGPVFANIILADEINRTPPKTQAALLESMQEYSVTIAGHFHQLDRPIYVLATQNPIEQEGTYPLPEAQLDRFMFNILLDYPSFKDEVEIVEKTTTSRNVEISKVMGKDEILFYQDLIKKVPVTPNVVEYAVNLVHKTRPGTDSAAQVSNDYLDWGAGPRASQFLITGAKCAALLNGKYSPDIEDIKAIAKPAMRHRILRNFKAEAEGITVDKIIEELL